MGGSSGPNIVNDDLVFAYDIDENAGINKSWRGAPTTNIVTNTNLDTGWSKGYCTSIQWDDYPPPPGVNSQVVSFIDADSNGSGYWYSYGDYAPQGDGVTYYTSVWARTVGYDWTIRPYTANNSESGRIWLNTMTVPGDGQWHRLEFNAITTANPNDSDSLSFNFPSIPANQRCWLCAPQMTTGGHYPFVDGTRSNTQAILDWAGGNTITANGMVYNTDGTVSWDGTGETDGSPTGSYLAVPTSVTNTSTSTYPNGCTYNWWQYINTGSVDRQSLFWGAGSIQHIEQYTSGKSFRTEATTQNGYSFGAGTFPDDVRGAWSNFSIVFANNETGRPVRWYQNGELFHTHASMNSGTGGATEYFQFSGLGRATGSSAYLYAQSLNGKMPVMQIYNRSLSADEVRQNFNALRGRYGL